MLIYFRSILKQVIYVNANQVRFRSWSQPVLRNEFKVSCSVKQQEPLMGFELRTDQLRVRLATHCTMSSLS